MVAGKDGQMRIESRIVDITVFPDRARVTRRGTLALEAGTHRVEFVELPLTLVADSIRASGQGTAVAALLGVDARREHFRATPSTSVRDLERQLEEATDRDRELADRGAAAELEAQTARSLATELAHRLARGLASGSADLERAETLLEFLPRRLGRAQDTLRDLERERRELARKVAMLQAQLEQQRSAQSRERYLASVEVQVREAGDLTLELSYLVGPASWTPLYDVRLGDETGGALQISYLGQVTQRTGEEWDEVSLALSTARPALAAVEPELSPWYLDLYPAPRPVMAPQQPGFGGAEAAAESQPLMSRAAAPAAPRPMEMLAASVVGSGASVHLRLSQRVSIPPDGTPHKVNVTTLELPPQRSYLSVPRFAECAYLRARARNDSPYLLLAGQASLFLEGAFVGSRHLPMIAPNEEMDLTVGVDDRIAVKRELKLHEVDKKFLSGRRRVRLGYEIEIRNLSDQRVELEVRDQFPLSRHEQIKTRLESVEPKPTSQSDLNELQWQLQLAPGARSVLRFEFSVEHPAGVQVPGLP